MPSRYLAIAGLCGLLAALLILTRPATPAPAPPAPAGAAAGPSQIVHPCRGINPQPPFTGVSPLSLTWMLGMCNAGTQWGYGDLGTWQAAGHSYVVISGYSWRAFYIWAVDDPYAPDLRAEVLLPQGGTTSTSVFAFRQGADHYVSFTLRGAEPGCGYFLYQVNDPATPVFVARAQGADWCTVHEHFVSTDAAGNADFAWLTMGAEKGSGRKMVVLDLRHLPQLPEIGRYTRPHATPDMLAHDVTVVGNRVYLAYWAGGLIILDKATLTPGIDPPALNPVDSIMPTHFVVHHAWPTSDGRHVFVESEYLNDPHLEKVKLYNIADLARPFYETGIIGEDVAAANQAHNLKIVPQGPGHDLLLVGWYQAGTRGFSVDTTARVPRIQPVLSHQLLLQTDGNFGGAWGVDDLPCTVGGQARTCLYTSDMNFGLVVDALGVDPALDRYPPAVTIGAPAAGAPIPACAYTIRGTAQDYWSGVARVDVSTDGGGTWQPARGQAAWQYT
ncbi:MAG TPA: hypothetical protein VKY74_24285, partial [Chloroflexia bacterium]|nr:hypothetical protein [Chloroflexia bacterium]